MMLSARAIALQGFGFGALLVAVQGFAIVDAPVASLGGGNGLAASDDHTDYTARHIDNQNRALITLVMGFAATGAFE